MGRGGAAERERCDEKPRHTFLTRGRINDPFPLKLPESDAFRTTFRRMSLRHAPFLPPLLTSGLPL